VTVATPRVSRSHKTGLAVIQRPLCSAFCYAGQ
jgi:hypothetical protein